MSEESTATTVELGADLDVTMVSPLRDQLLMALEQGAPVCLDGREVQRVDAAGIQLLLSLVMSAPAGGWSWRGGAPPEAVREVAASLGVESRLTPAPE